MRSIAPSARRANVRLPASVPVNTGICYCTFGFLFCFKERPRETPKCAPKGFFLSLSTALTIRCFLATTEIICQSMRNARQKSKDNQDSREAFAALEEASGDVARLLTGR
jgi:hypothetical protein